MPTVLRVAGYRFFFFSNEDHEPAHIHVESGEKLAKYWLEPPELASSRGFRAHELTAIRVLVDQNRIAFLRAWHEHFNAGN